jgi:tetratricopeptide (TPR) repeat protein
MKKQPLRPRSGTTTPIPVRRQFDHEVPTVIHHPEEKMTALARLTRRIILDPRKYASWALAIAIVVLAIVVGMNWSSATGTKTYEVWSKIDTATKPEDLAAAAKDSPGTDASEWVLMLAANEYYNSAMADLPNNRDVAVPNLKKALDLYEQVARQAPKESYRARAALFGKARCLEARNELAQAIEQYELIAKQWPDSTEADQARQLAQALKKPEAVAFYKDLYAYSPTKVTLPPLSTESIKLPTRPGAGSVSGKTPSSMLEVTPPDISEIRPAPAPELPANVFTPEPNARPKAPQ